MNARTLTALLAVVVAVSLAPAAGAQSGFGISSSDTTPVPERTETVGGDTFTFDSMIRADEGDTVTLDVTAPNEDSYRLHVRNSDNEIVDQPQGTGDESFTVDLSNYEYGSYAFGVYQDGSYETVQPLLVSGYDVAVDAPESVSSDGSAEVTVDLTETAASADPANVQVIVAQDDTTETFDASGGDGEYTATVDGGALEEGDYTVYGVAQGDEEAFGRSELLGLSDGHSLAVEAGSDGGDGTDGDDSDGETETTEEPDETNDSDGSDDDGSDGSGSSDGDDSGDESTDDGEGAAEPPANETTETETTTEPPTATEAVTETATDTDDGVVTPADDTETETESTGMAGPGFTVAGALAALALVGLLGRRRL